MNTATTATISTPNAFRLADMVIHTDDHTDSPKSWSQFFCSPGGVDAIEGPACIDQKLDDVLFLGKWTSTGYSGPILTSDEIEPYLALLPTWTRTKWAFRCQDLGEPILIDCRTSDVADFHSPETHAVCLKIRALLANRLHLQRQIHSGEFDADGLTKRDPLMRCIGSICLRPMRTDLNAETE